MPPTRSWPLFLLLLFFQSSGSMPGADAPSNISIMFLNPTSVRVSWQMATENVDKYDVTYKPTDASYRVVAVVAGNSEAVTLENLLADTQYQVTVTAVSNGNKYKSRPIVFRTLEPPRSSPQHDSVAQVTRPPGLMTGSQTDGSTVNLERPPIRDTSSANERLRPGQKNKSLSGDEEEDDDDIEVQVRGVEVGIVLVVLAVWVGAIVLFFNRWGKIRMLLPYQPDYKQEQLKVPGTSCTGGGGSSSGSAGPPVNSQQSQSCSQSRPGSRHFEFDQWPDCDPPLRPSNAWRSRFLSRRTRSAESLLAASRRATSSCCNIHLYRQSDSKSKPRPLTTPSVDVPILSISAPSPSDEDEEEEEEDQEDPHRELV